MERNQVWEVPLDLCEVPRKRRVMLRWTMHEHESMLDAKRVLSLEEHGMLQVLHDLYCGRLGVLYDQARFIAGQAGIDPRVWKRIRGKLLELGFLETDGDRLICTLKREAVSQSIKLMENGAKGGRASGEARRGRNRPTGFKVPALGNDILSDT